MRASSLWQSESETTFPTNTSLTVKTGGSWCRGAGVGKGYPFAETSFPNPLLWETREERKRGKREDCEKRQRGRRGKQGHQPRWLSFQWTLQALAWDALELGDRRLVYFVDTHRFVVIYNLTELMWHVHIYEKKGDFSWCSYISHVIEMHTAWYNHFCGAKVKNSEVFL